jgi:glycosyltransferase involved in cell wall biosynthesis
MLPYLEVFYGTTPLRCEFLEEVYKVPKHKIQLLNFGADDTAFNNLSRQKLSVDFRKKNKIDEDSFIFITGGKIDERKNIHLIMQAFIELELPNVYLVVFGVPNDFMKKRLEKYKNAKNIIQLGWLNNKQIYEVLLSSNFGLFPGTHSVLWEQAVGIGLPCAFKRWHGMEHVDVGGNCIFFEEGTKDEITEVINKIIYSTKYFENINLNALKYGPINFSYSEISKKAINKN